MAQSRWLRIQSVNRVFRLFSSDTYLLLAGIFRKSVVAQFDQREGSSDGGALLLKAADRQYGLVAGLSSCLRDDRQAGKVDHSLRATGTGTATGNVSLLASVGPSVSNQSALGIFTLNSTGNVISSTARPG